MAIEQGKSVEQPITKSLPELFSPLPTNINNLNCEGVLKKWRNELHNIINTIPEKGLIKQQWHDGVEKWLDNSHHGIRHSLYVYSGARHLMEEEGIYNSQLDSLLQAEAVIHDLFQVVPWININTQKKSEKDQRLYHGTMSAIATQAVGRMFGISSDQFQIIANDLCHHDDSYNGQIAKLSFIGEYISDADKLFGASFERDPKKLIEEAIKRNREGVKKDRQIKLDGWPFFRGEEIVDANWQYGDRWYADGLAASKADIFTQYFYTNQARKIAGEIRQDYPQIAQEMYGEEYEEIQEMVNYWRNNQSTATVEMCGYNGLKENRITIKPVDKELSPEQVIINAYNTELNIPEKPNKAKPKGWMIKITAAGDEKSFVIDPSIARFKTKEEFLAALEKRIKN